MLLDDRSYTDFALRHMPYRPGLIIVLVDPDDVTLSSQAAALGAEAVIRAGDNLSWLHLPLHDAPGCRYTRWDAPGQRPRRPCPAPPPAVEAQGPRHRRSPIPALRKK
ncbi:hypothetical protein ACFVYR_37735 [Streptomyces sp. NPDC058284]|uniref:hypothetical protein n=1 Tax=unclassified Streptomyces TaxID=2593676 RepID=UPI0036464088